MKINCIRFLNLAILLLGAIATVKGMDYNPQYATIKDQLNWINAEIQDIKTKTNRLKLQSKAFGGREREIAQLERLRDGGRGVARHQM